MASFETFPKIKIRIEDAEDRLLNDFTEKFDDVAHELRRTNRRGVYLFDVDDAERAVAWLKEHGVEQEPKAPKRDTGKRHDPNGKHVHERGEICSVCGGKLTEMPGGSLWCSMHGPRGREGMT